MKLRKKTFWAGALLVPAGLLGLAHLYYTVDDPPPEDSDLSTAYEAVPYEENGFPLIQEAGLASWPDVVDCRDQDLDRNWNQDLARETLEKNRALLAKVDEALSRPRFQLPLLAGPDSVIPCSGWTGIAEVLAIRLQALAREGKEQEALEGAVGLVRWGHQIESADGSLCVWMIGNGIKCRGLVWFRRVLARSRLPAAELEPYLSRLSLYQAQEKGFSRALKLDYRIQCAGIDLLSRGEEIMVMMDLRGTSRVLGAAYLLNPNRTKAAFAGGYRQILQALSRPAADQPAADFLRPKRISFCSIVEVSWFPRKNAVGKALFDLVMPAEAQCLERLRSEKLWIARTQVLLACRCYHEREGRLPATLDDLKPRYLKELPLDPYDGRPLRYSAERKIIWSVGEDLKDAGGSSQVEEGSMEVDRKEPTFSIDFRTRAVRN